MKECNICLYNDDAIPHIDFDETGVCNYCRQHETMSVEFPIGESGDQKLNDIIQQIKEDGKTKQYDVVVGFSGGCDSSYLLDLAVKHGLRPLAVHYDNTWNSKIAVENIYKLTKKLNVDLYTHVVDTKEHNLVYRSLLNASVPDIDSHNDMGLQTTLYLAAEKYNIKYIWQGHAFRTEGITPHGWTYIDAKYVQSVHTANGGKKIKTIPLMWLHKWFKWMLYNKIKRIRPLYYIDYKKQEVKKYLKEKYDWEWYGGHHMENKTAYFVNNYWLPNKFKIDTRIVELSAQIRSGHMTKQEAKEVLSEKMTYDDSLTDEVKSRLGLTDEEFGVIMRNPNKSFKDFKNYKKTFENLRWVFWLLYKSNFVPKSFYDKYTKKYD